MIYDSEVKKILGLARKMGIRDAEVFINMAHYFIIKVQGQEFDEFKFSRVCGAGFRVIENGEEGYAYTEKFDEDSFAMCLEWAREAAGTLCPQDTPAVMKGFKTKEHEEDLKCFNPALELEPEHRKIETAMAVERAALAFDPRVASVQMVRYSDGHHFQRVANTRGMDKWYQSNYAMAIAYVVAAHGDERRVDGHYAVARDLNDIDPQKLGETAAKRAIRKLGSREISSGEYTVAFDNEVMCEILEAFSSIFSARQAQEGRSLLQGRLGERIGSTKITLVDDALRPGGLATHPFDDEGHPTKKIDIVRKGVFKNFLHNLRTAAKWGVKSTGHGTRSSYKDTLGVSATNMYLEPGTHRFPELMNLRRKILHIASVQGLHSGLNPVTGDFSLSASGFLYESGSLKYPIHNFTVSGNIVDLFSNVAALGSDLKFGFPSGCTHVGSPTVLVRKIMVGGA
ncbi:MAG: hypothetical protein CVV64_17780 [Candidatus Wallbacteria bacterium HGW-Wallbacteria-1]|jgi:PmbA protein|uniref:TldD/PmbA family protein n=1 Tax=Candidatus Wallbacteria bacterium HGW-Wallbacteria-1 TaxID=2013854 RepID=A0A2N1PK15_9BACT|nr:MAG: hypothetical protein CVV64_17780 [Candidatus Wallbacteria bacterium HGW-Wallbacteria-1]